tara:strand:+ start:4394 stop:4585 length:192 start_codon:yes stop_codon:yes gene_type:complete
MEKKIIHEHRLSTSLMVILGIFAFGFVMIGIDGYLIKDAIAELNSGELLRLKILGKLQVQEVR